MISWPIRLAALASVVAAQETEEPIYDFWFVRLLTNLAGYGSIIIPAYLYKQYLDKKCYKDNGSGFFYPYIVTLFYGKDVHDVEQGKDVVSPAAKEPATLLQTAVKLCFCAGGLYTSYLTWGVLQERIITQEYGAGDTPGSGEKFGDSQFLVFINRGSALLVAGIYLQMKRQPKHGCPFYKYSPCSLSNILSSWFQYEALKFVSFPTQVLAKACKIIPVMLMGKAVSGNKYPLFDWVTAAQLGVGTSIFLLSNPENGNKEEVATTFSGLFCLIGYMVCDSFTSNWQSEVFKYKMSSMEMMFGVNCFSCLFTSWSLLQQGSFATSLGFMLRHPDFTWHATLLSAASASGQLFIYYTISQFGAIVFTIIMTTRAALAIILSCIIYGHPVTGMGVFGLFVAFSSLGLRIWYKIQNKKKAAAAKSPA